MENNVDSKFNYKIVIIPLLIFLFVQFYNAFNDDTSDDDAPNENTKELSSDDTTIVDDNNIITNNPKHKTTYRNKIETSTVEDEPYPVERITRVLDKDEDIATFTRTEDNATALFIESKNVGEDAYAKSVDKTAQKTSDDKTTNKLNNGNTGNTGSGIPYYPKPATESDEDNKTLTKEKDPSTSNIKITSLLASINEDIAIGTNVGQITVEDSEEDIDKSFALEDTTNFTISNEGIITTKTNFDYESGDREYNLTVTAKNT